MFFFALFFLFSQVYPYPNNQEFSMANIARSLVYFDEARTMIHLQSSEQLMQLASTSGRPLLVCVDTLQGQHKKRCQNLLRSVQKRFEKTVSIAVLDMVEQESLAKKLLSSGEHRESPSFFFFINGSLVFPVCSGARASYEVVDFVKKQLAALDMEYSESFSESLWWRLIDAFDAFSTTVSGIFFAGKY